MHSSSLSHRLIQRQALASALWVSASLMATGAMIVLPASSATAAEASLDHVVAIVDDSVLLSSEVDQAMAEAMQAISARGQTPPSPELLRVDVIRQLILRKIQLGMIERNGASVDDEALNHALLNIAQQQGIPTLSAFQSRLDSIQPNGYAQFRKKIRDEMNINRLQQQRVGSRIKISDRDIDNFLSSPQSADALKTEFNFTVIQVPVANTLSSAAKSKALSNANELIAQLRAGKPLDAVSAQYNAASSNQGWHKSDELPTPFLNALSKLKKGEVSEPLPAEDSVNILQLNDERGGVAGAVVHQYHVRHILVKTSEIINEEEAKLKIDSIAAKLKAGAAFADMARAYSDDPGSAQAGGDLNWVSPGEMVPTFEATMIKTPVGQISAPFQSPFGWHILQVEATRDQDMTQEYRRAAAKQALYERQYPVELDNWLREIRASAYVDMKESADQ